VRQGRKAADLVVVDKKAGLPDREGDPGCFHFWKQAEKNLEAGSEKIKNE